MMRFAILKEVCALVVFLISGALPDELLVSLACFDKGMNSVAGCAVSLYGMWWVFYVSFMLLVGRDLPKKYTSNGQEANPKWDTGA